MCLPLKPATLPIPVALDDPAEEEDAFERGLTASAPALVPREVSAGGGGCACDLPGVAMAWVCDCDLCCARLAASLRSDSGAAAPPLLEPEAPGLPCGRGEGEAGEGEEGDTSLCWLIPTPRRTFRYLPSPSAATAAAAAAASSLAACSSSSGLQLDVLCGAEAVVGVAGAGPGADVGVGVGVGVGVKPAGILGVRLAEETLDEVLLSNAGCGNGDDEDDEVSVVACPCPCG